MKHIFVNNDFLMSMVSGKFVKTSESCKHLDHPEPHILYVKDREK